MNPSYVGLSCSVSGYSSFNRYNPGNHRESSPPTAIPVPEGPQTLNAMRHSRNEAAPASTTTHKYVQSPGGLATLETVTKFYSSPRNNRESSPGSDSGSCSSGVSSGSQSGGPGNLVQKQIERLYGGKIHSIRSPPRSEDSGREEDHLKPAFSPRDPPASRPLEFKPLKIPAVFRLLRPEFREQLKTHSCKVDIPDENLAKTERIIPITRLNHTYLDKKDTPARERVIPIQKENHTHRAHLLPLKTPSPRSPVKPALPAKPPSPSVNDKRREKSPLTPDSEEAEKGTLTPEEHSFRAEPFVEPCDETDDLYIRANSDDEDEPSSLLRGGLRERELLCTIVEEDNESTASGCSLSRINGHHTLAVHKPEEEEALDILPKKDGNYFIKLIENEVFKFEEQICDFEEDLCNNESLMSEDVRESILAAIGKAKLLMSQKLAQFRGLCDRNINSNVEEDPFVPTSDDLAGFWDMVYIQVEHIYSLFAELVAIRKNGWKRPEVEVKKPTNGNNSSKRQPKKKPAPKKPQSEASKARDEARRKMLEERKKELMRQKQNASNLENGVQMFV